MAGEKLDTPTARARLTPRREPYWQSIAGTRVDVGFRRGPDTWIAREHRPDPSGKRKSPYRYSKLALPATIAPREQFDAAVRAVRELAELTDRPAGGPLRYTVKQAIDDYVANLRTDRGNAAADDAKGLLYKSVEARIGPEELASVTTDALLRWRNSFVPAHTADADSGEKQRKAKATANRHWAVFRACLVHALERGNVADDAAWRRIKPFRNVDQARDFYPAPEQVAELLKHCAADFRPLVRALALTGFRLQALTGAHVADFDEAQGTLAIEKDKKHKRTAPLSRAAIELFKQQAKDKLPSAYLFTRADGEPWGKSHQHRPFREACAAAKLPREFIVYSLRHYFVSRALLAGMNVHALAKAVGTSSAMVERHYAKFIRTDVRDMLDRVEVIA